MVSSQAIIKEKNMNSEQKHSLHIVIAMLDKKMEDSPNRELADVTNYLQALYEQHDKN